MVKLKNYNALLQHFVIFLTFATLISCGEKRMYVTKIDGKEIGITDKNKEITAFEDIIKPYRSKIDNDLNEVLAYAPKTIDKIGQWQTPMGNLLADITFQKSEKLFNSREKKSIDVCLLNHGGIRTIIPKGNVTTRAAFEIQPFENTAQVIGLKSDQIIEMVDYIIKEKKPHPLSGMSFTIDKNNTAKDILIQGKPLEKDKIYYVVSSDYLINGGDNMNFFKKGIEKYDLEYKLRNIIIDYFKEVDTISVNTNKRINVEN